MRITEISIKLGSTVNLGDYNNFRPEIGGKVVVEPFDDPDRVFVELEEQLAERLARLVDDELERAGQEPRYASDLYAVLVSDVRSCVVVMRPHVTLPADSNWRDKDSWDRVRYGLPGKMRYDTAHKLGVETAQAKGYLLNFLNEPDDAAKLPDLPDPGPVPSWYVKKLRSGLNALRIPEAAWEQVAELPHVDAAYLDNFYGWYHRSPRYLTTERMVEMFIAGETPWENAAATPEPDDFDEEE